MGMADFHIALLDFESAAHALTVTEHVSRGADMAQLLQGQTGGALENSMEKLAELKVQLLQ